MYNHILHDHLDGGLRPSTAKELAENIGYKPINNVEDVANFFDRSNCDSLEDYLEAFTHTIALMQSYENIEQIAYEAAKEQEPEAMGSVSFEDFKPFVTWLQLGVYPITIAFSLFFGFILSLVIGIVIKKSE